MADSYRPSRNDRDRPPPLSDRMTFTHGNSRDNNHRLNGHSGSNGRHGEFTFQAQHPAPHFPPAGSAPTGPRAQRNRGGEPPRGPRRAQNREHQNGRNNANGRRRGGFRKPAPHERELLRVRDGGSPEQTLGVAEGSNRFMNPDDLSDDDEAEMDVESDSGSDALSPLPDQPAKRKLNKTTAASGADGDSEPKWAAGAPVTVPKWSNPDPYTSLPPPSETTGVKRDVVQLIRKAKNQALTKAAGANAVAANDDFISFGDDDDNQDEDDEDEDEPLIIDAALRRDHVDEQTARELDAARRDVERAPRGGGRKRGHALQTRLVAEWEPRMRGTSTPWLHNSSDYAHLEKNPQRWLHNEILDFYDFVAPKPFEHEARHKLVQRVSAAFAGRQWFHGESGRILCFGSFPAGLYLPAADMDLVYASDRHFNGGPPAMVSDNRTNPFKKVLHGAARKLENARITASRPIVIVGAKVPIIKFQDNLTGIDVDISFENLSGVQAQATFDSWKREYPDMIYLVALVKQFLVMRGLNEVHTGGLGGFSIICLIVSYIHHAATPTDLGECFLGFLEFYGKKFDLATQRIQTNPHAVVPKGTYGIDGRPEKPDGLSIQDPNRPENNISGGSRKAEDCFAAFGEAYDTLRDRMDMCKSGNKIGKSLLGYVLGGNYDSYISQRQHLNNLR